jgi:hypothetical protein
MSTAVITSIKWSAISYFDSICQCCETDVWRVKQFLDCVVPFHASICECSSENKRHTHTGLWSWISLEIVVLRLYVFAPVCHLSLTLKPVSYKLVILVYSRILSGKLCSPTHSTTNFGLSFETVNCPELRTINWFVFCSFEWSMSMLTSEVCTSLFLMPPSGLVHVGAHLTCCGGARWDTDFHDWIISWCFSLFPGELLDSISSEVTAASFQAVT